MPSILKVCFLSLLIGGFVYSCNGNAKAKKTATSYEASSQTQQTSKQMSEDTQSGQATKQMNAQSPKKKKKKISKNWKTFFSGETKTKVRVHLLQHGPKFKKALKKFSQSSMAQKASATITGIKLTSDTTAKVSYTINIGGAPVLTDKTGKALYIDGTWKVDDAAFCGLIKLSGNVPKPCPSSSGSNS